MARLFGTDGVRGLANGDLTAELAMELSVGAAHVLGEIGVFGGERPRALVGRDTRASGDFLMAAITAGLASAGVDVEDLGIIPTPGLAYLVNETDAALGVMLSASHNPMPDNGIKFFQRGGVKLDDAIEDTIEDHMGEKWKRPTGADVGRVTLRPDLVQRYVDHLVRSLGTLRLDGLKVVLDTANGAATVTAEEVFERCGAEVTAIHNRPNGANINDNCGSTHIESLQQAVVELGADLGLAFDGDADRCMAVDANGDLVDGDQIMAILAVDMAERGKLRGKTLVATVMSNLGLFNAMRDHGIRVDKTKVGDRYVLESMVAHGFTLGGEQSGHVIMSEFATTGDGVLTALHVAASIVKSGKPLAELASVMTRLPQAMINVKNVDKLRASLDKGVLRAVAAVEEELGDTGRVLLRPSGTEPVVRVMVEAATQEEADAAAQRLVAVVKERLSL